MVQDLVGFGIHIDPDLSFCWFVIYIDSRFGYISLIMTCWIVIYDLGFIFY